MLKYTLKVESLKKETGDVITVCFKQPSIKKLKYLAGQYLTVIFWINGRKYMRPYSFSSAPGIDSSLNITVKRVLGGVISNHIIDNLQVGDMIEVMEPMGNFILDMADNTARTKRLVLWGVGSGITPLISIAKFALHNNIFSHVDLVYGNRKFDTTIFVDEIKELQNKFINSFDVLHFLTEAVIKDDLPNVIQGRISPQVVLDIINQETEIINTIHYVCGPFGLKESVKDILKFAGVAEKNIYFEDFELVRDPKAFENIFTQTVLLKFDKQNICLEVVKGKSILEAGLDSTIDLSYSCQAGSCLLCKAKLLKGQVKTIGIDVLPNELTLDECLLCCSFPLTNDVELFIN